jgi:signal peptidase I
MKNIQVIDGADNTGYWIYQISDKLFKTIFPKKGQNIEFISDVIKREEKNFSKLWNKIWNKRIEKHKAKGIHGTLFYELDFKKEFYPNKRESDLINQLWIKKRKTRCIQHPKIVVK